MSGDAEDTVVEGRHFVVAIPDLGFCESAEAGSFTEAAELIRLSGQLDSVLNECLSGFDAQGLFRGFEVYIVEEANHHTVAKVRLSLSLGFGEGGGEEGVVPLPPAGS